jgi:hypothetical protein
MYTIKFILFIEFIGMFVTATFHLIFFFLKQEFPLLMYPFIALVVLFSCLVAIYVFIPLGDWWMN